jgi:poly(3-hydroxybutyrate) depolymerase
MALGWETPDFARAYAAVVASVPASENMAVTPSNQPVSMLIMNGKRSVALYTIKGGGHGAPHPALHGPRLLGNSNRDIHAANEIWDFFQSVP